MTRDVSFLLLLLLGFSGCAHTEGRELDCPLTAGATPVIGPIPNDNDVQLLTPGTPELEQQRQMEELQSSLREATMQLRHAGDGHQLLVGELEKTRSQIAALESQAQAIEEQNQQQNAHLEQTSQLLSDRDRQIASLAERLNREQMRANGTEEQLRSVKEAQDAELSATMKLLDELIAEHGLATSVVKE